MTFLSSCLACAALLGVLQPVCADRSQTQESAKSMEVRASPHSFGFKRRYDAAEGVSQEQREEALQHQLELTREERGEAESLQASEHREAAALAQKLEYAAENEEHTQEMLREARRELAANKKEASSTHAALNRYLGLADELRVTASQASQQAAEARREAQVAKRSAVHEKKQARRDLAAFKAMVSEADETAETVSRERQELRRLEANAMAEQRAAEEARERYDDKFKKARRAQAVAEHQRKMSLAEEKELASEEYAAVLKERWKASKAMEVAKDAEVQRQAHFKAAVTMRQETEEAQALVEQAAGEKAAAQREKSLAMWTKQQAKRDSQNMSTLAFISWGLLVLVLIGVLGFSSEIQKLEAGGLRPLKLLDQMRGCAALQRKQPARGVEILAEPEPVAITPPVVAEDEASDDVPRFDLAAHDTDTD